MGIFGCYEGSACIPQEKQKEFTENVIKLLDYGGMMQFEQVCIYGKEVMLIKPVEMNAEGKAYFHYNYFEDNAWESAGYDVNGMYFFSGKIGSREFCDVVTAIHALYELYDEGVGMTQIDGENVEISPCIGWINHVLGTEFSLQKRFDLWKYFERYCLDKLENGDDDFTDSYDVMDMVPPDLYAAMGGTDFADIWYVSKGTDSIQPEELVSGSYPETIYKCRELLRQYLGEKRSDEREKAWDMIKVLLTSERDERAKWLEGEIGQIAQMSLRIPAHMLAFLACEIENKDFWVVWAEVRKEAYMDAELSGYASDELIKERKIRIGKPVGKITTAEYLCQDDSFAFWDTPEELKGKPDYYLSDDDRAFWWDGSENVVLSKEMDEWLTELARQHKHIMDEVILEEKDKEKFLNGLLSLLEEIEHLYKRVFCFQNMFYEFLQNAIDKRYIAAIKLLERLALENREKGKVIEKIKSWWDITSRNVTHNEGRLVMKRYLSVMANRELRKRYFGF